MRRKCARTPDRRAKNATTKKKFWTAARFQDNEKSELNEDIN